MIFWIKYQRIEALVKAFRRYMKAFMTLKIKKSVPKKLAFAFNKSDFLHLADFGLLDLAKFTMVDRFSILLPTLRPSALAILFDTS